MTGNEICTKCKHYGKVDWSHSSFGCTKAVTRDGTGGYGPFYSHAVCLFDTDGTKLKNLFEPAAEIDVLFYKERIEQKDKSIYELQNKINKLESALVKLGYEQ
jgi:hypothetical protein